MRSSAVIILRQPCDSPVRGVVSSSTQALLIVDATPGNAEVFVNGRLLGSASALVGRAVPISPGKHSLEIISRGFRPFSTQFTASPTFPTRLRVALAPQ